MRRQYLPLIALVLAALPAAAQETPLPELFSDTIDVRVVNVEVVVTDREGNRVQGLGAADFELRVDGESVPVEYFTEVGEGIARTSARGDAPGTVSSLVSGEPVPTNYLVFIDEYFAVRRDRDRVLDRLEQDLMKLSAHDRVALAATATDTRSYYWLGFEPPRNEDDTLHDIEVQLVGRPGLRVRSRRSYLDLSKSTEVTMMVELWMSEVELRVTVVNESGDRSETPVETVRISGPSEPEPGQHWWYTTELELRKREHRIVVAVHDPVSGTILSASETIGPR